MSVADQHYVETYKSLMTYGSAGLKFTFLANGTAALAIMTFLGHFATSKKIAAPILQGPLALFVTGILLGGLATATAYMTQLCLLNESHVGFSAGPWHTRHTFWLRVSIILIVGGIVLFGVGALWAVARLQ